LGHTLWLEKEKIYTVHEYPASKGLEHFIAYETEDQKTLFGFLRLREPSDNAFRPEILNPSATIIRELHVYGKLVGLGKFPRTLEWQHRGIGKQLISMAEEKSVERGFKKMAVTSALGVKEYYRKFGFEEDGPYMSKTL